jgi:hypothetical protein
VLAGSGVDVEERTVAHRAELVAGLKHVESDATAFEPSVT